MTNFNRNISCSEEFLKRGHATEKNIFCNYSGPWFPGNGKGGPLKNRSHSGKHGAALFAHRREIAADDAKSGCPLGTAKGARNLLLDLHHAQIPLGLVVAKRHGEIVQESENLLGSGQQSIQEIFGVCLFATTRLFGNGSLWGRSLHPMEGKALLQNGKILEHQ